MSPTPEKPVIVAEGEFSGDVVVLSTDTADLYVWYLNGQSMEADLPVIETAEDGTYTVQVTKNNCVSEMSDPYLAIVTSAQFPVDEVVSVFPNPFADKLTISGQPCQGTIRVRDAHGILVLEQSVASRSAQYELDLSHLAAGFYSIEVTPGGKRSVTKIIRQ